MKKKRQVKSVADIGEGGLIDFVSKLAKVKKSVVKGIGDDTAVIQQSNDRFMLITADMLIEGTHFKKKDLPSAIGHKALACNISDIAAMGGLPDYAVVSLGLPKNLSVVYAKGIFRGIDKLASKYNISIIGGDTVASSKISVNIALIGHVKKSQLVLRSKARIGDRLIITGPLGGSYGSKRHLNFEPQLEASQYIVKNFNPTSMIDISDGLVCDLHHILKASSKGAKLMADSIPLQKKATLNNALYDGEDFQLLFTLSKVQTKKLISKKNKRFTFYDIGEVTSTKEKVYLNDNGESFRLAAKARFAHFN